MLGAFTREDIVSFNQTVGRPARIVHHFQDWAGSTGGGKDFDPAMMNRAVDSGGRPMVTWMSGDLTQEGATQPYYSNKNIYLNKEFDSHITTWATAARDWGNSCAEARGASSPCVMFLRFDHEMNGHWFPWSPGVNGNTHYDYVRAWRHVHDIFAKVGAKNVRWVWSGSQCTTSSCSSLSASYPGDSYVDWTALSGYNRQLSEWRTGSEIFGPNYDQITTQIAPGKPFMIAEVGVREDPDQPYRKANWLLQFFNSEIPNRLPKTKAVVYYSRDTSAMIPGTNLEVDSSPESLAAYRKVAAQWGWGGTLEDTTRPFVESLWATNRTSTGVPLRDTNFTATFSERMNTATLNDSTYKLFECPTTTSTDCTTQITDVTVTPSADGLSATLNPYGVKTTLLSASTRYKVVITNAADAAGNSLDRWTESYFTTGSSDTPPQTAITSKPPSATRSTAASFKFTSSELDSTFRCSIDDKPLGTCYASGKSYYSLTDGPHTFRVQATDALGYTDPTPATWAWQVDTVGPTGKVLIDGGKRYTAKRTVALTLGASDPAPASGVSHMRFRNNGATTWSAWQAYATSKSWLLGSGAGKKTVDVQYKDRAGNVSSSRSDVITYRP